MNLKYLYYWFPMIVIAFANATIRELLFMKYFTELRSHQFSTITLIMFCSVYLWFIYSSLNIQSSTQAILIGFIWVALTVTFEFTLGRLTNKSWSYLLNDYNIFAGRIWLIFIILLFLLPYLFYRLRK
ncbi:hypothetical protein FBQ84_01000 [Ignavibacteria bacterium CHB1]|nr:MAG: hypothetical protein EDM69_01475 [Chlorobiota bacterium]MBV6398660.1 hypothetical protein [Ignavibacteria bacterium]MCC6885172.1 hypothetical protein [Ignavibacteriales bacterium]MCE7952038.1 hypothetical protein [Chlorobi bacterium CHB7]MDL1886404.1 hypothetical protein [Ignavibacteria bacterium CHB1]RIK48849.1 MAG: hypothetical protein DCC60_06040 [Ignavibacteriota bacterium]